MISLSLAEIGRIVGGELSALTSPDALVTAPVAFDSRQVRPGGLFLAIRGEHADGHDFAADAVAAGAVGAIVTSPVAAPSIRVDDPLAAVASLAAAVVRRLPDLTVVGITGSSGKTSTKDLVAQLLEPAGPTVAPPGSYNNELGLPYTVLLADPSTRYLVLEFSARGVGHIRYLTEVAPPQLGVVLNVGHAHVGEFGSQQAIAQAKGELVEALPADGVAVLNADDALVAAMAARTSAEVVTFGRGPRADVRAEDVEVDPLGRPSFVLHAMETRHRVRLGLTGAHQVDNALAAAAVALECGRTVPEVAAGLETARPRSRWRMEITERADGVVVLNDAYNANPESVRAALTTLAGIGRSTGARTVAVLGPMAELGPLAQSAHEQIGQLALRLGVTELLAVGEPARAIVDGAPAGPGSGYGVWVPDVDAAVARLSDTLRPGDVVLVKASRSARLERVAFALTENVPDRPAEVGRA